ncbi:hypothetical protein K1719_021887 [Acacia pycnantha]|nr:hypothetical protein K1719_021887 [Acacia pycnantha]
MARAVYGRLLVARWAIMPRLFIVRYPCMSFDRKGAKLLSSATFQGKRLSLLLQTNVNDLPAPLIQKSVQQMSKDWSKHKLPKLSLIF